MEHKPLTNPWPAYSNLGFSFSFFPVVSYQLQFYIIQCPINSCFWGVPSFSSLEDSIWKPVKFWAYFRSKWRLVFLLYLSNIFSQHMQFWKFGGITRRPPPPPRFGWGILNFNHIMCLDQLHMSKNIWGIISTLLDSDLSSILSIFWTTSVRFFKCLTIYQLSGSTSGPPVPPSSGNSALLGGVVKGANSLFSNIKDMSNKVMQSVAG